MSLAFRNALLLLTLTIAASAFGVSGAMAQRLQGTAFSVAPEYLITNQHVVDGCLAVEVLASDGRRRGSIVAEDKDIDLALLRVSGMKGSMAKLRNPQTVRLGEAVNLFGYPLAGSLSSGGNFTTGIVSALRGLRDAAGEIQVTAPVQPGNSGGPVLDRSGLVIGVIQSKLDALRSAAVSGDIPQNVNFAISLDVLAGFLEKHKVDFRTASPSSSVDTASVAELAQEFTYRVECESTGKPVSAAEYLHMDVKQGRVVIKLRPDLAPKHVARLKELTDQGFYDGIIFHRVVAGFMAQTGDPKGTGTGGSGQKLPPEFTKTPFKRGTVGMARSQALNSADSQFFICFTETPSLIGQYTVWGEVVKGMEFVDQIQKGEPPRNPDRIVKMRVAQTVD